MSRRLPAVATVVFALLAAWCGPSAADPGDPDTGFGGGDGWWEAGYDRFGARDLAFDADGRIHLLGIVAASHELEQTKITRLLANGTPDLSYSGDGVFSFDAITGPTSWEDARAMTFDASGRLVVLDFVQDNCGEPPTFCNRYRLSRLTGTAVTSYPIQAVGPDFAEDVAVDPDGQIVVAGYDHDRFRLTVARFLGSNPGTLDTTFSGDGVRVLEVGAASAANVVQMIGRKALLGGFSRASFTHDGQTGRWLLLRLRADGSADPAFGGGDGLVHFRPKGMYGGIRDIALDGTGRILAAGTVRSCAETTDACRANERPAVARFLADGTLDTSFGVDGFAVLPSWVRTRTGAFNTVAWDPRGWIVAGGVSGVEGTVVRLTPRGRPDLTFAADGTFHVDPYPDAGGTSPRATTNEIVVRPSGAIFAAGLSRAFGGYHSALWKLRGGTGPS